MSVTYNAWGHNLSHIFRLTGTVFSANLVNDSVFDLFADNVAAGDMLYFGGIDTWGGNSMRCFCGLRLFIGVGLQASAITVAWEFWNGSAWVPLPGLVDGTDALRATGQRDARWVAPAIWPRSTINGVWTHWVRCRVVSVTAPTEGGAHSTQRVQAGNNTIVVTGPGHTFETIRNADIAGGWGVFTPIAPSPNIGYACTALLSIGDGVIPTTLTVTNRTLVLYWHITFAANSTTTFGTPSTYWGMNGVRLGFQHWNNWDCEAGVIHAASTLNWYGTQLGGSVGSLSFNGSGVLLDCILQTVDHLNINSSLYQITRCLLQGRGGNIGLWAGAALDRVIVNGLSLLGSATFTIAGLAYNALATANVAGAPTVTLLNPIGTAPPTFGGHATWNMTTCVFRAWSFGLRVIDAAFASLPSAQVTIVNALGATVLSAVTDANGAIPAMTLIERLWENNPVRDGGFTPQIIVHTPHTITLSRAGFKTRQIRLDMDRRREEVEMLTAYLPVQAAFTVGPAEAEREAQFADASIIDLAPGDTASYAWTFGDGVGVSALRNPRYQYAQAGTYNVTLTVTTSWGGSHSVTQAVVVSPLAPPHVIREINVAIGLEQQINAAIALEREITAQIGGV